MRLIITEKEIAARRIAKILTDGSVAESKTGQVPILKFTRDGEEYVCMGLKGHILEVDYPEDYKNWQTPPPSELIFAGLIKKPKLKYLVDAVRRQAKNADEIIIATDFDREGELIGSDVVKTIKYSSYVHGDGDEAEPGVNATVKVLRARFSALTPKEIEDAFGNLSELSNDLAQAGEARQDIDLVWGATLTRYISLATTMLGRYFLAVGRVQTPTLVLIAQLEKERRAFVNEPYWQITALIEADGVQFEATHKTKRFDNEKEARKIFERLGEQGVVSEVKDNITRLKPITPFNTTAFLAAASSSLGLSTANAMRIAESLYMNGYISYPRVDNTVYPDSLDIRGTLEIFSRGELMGLAQKLLGQDRLVPTRGKKQSTDHPPIHPSGFPDKDALDSTEWRVYEMVARRFMATLAPEAVIAKKRIDMDVNGEILTANGSHIEEQGWLEYYTYSRKKEKEVPDLKTGDEVKLIDKMFEAKETQPPGRYGQGRLIQKMEELGLGTKATRHVTIQRLYARGYVHSDPIIPTETGMAVAEALEKYAPEISTPEMTAELEHNMDAIVEGQIGRKEVVEKSRKLLKSVYDEMEKHKEEIATEIRAGISKDKTVGICQKCGGELRIVRSKKTKKRFVGCSGYFESQTDGHDSYPLPQSGDIVPLNTTCETCGSPMIKVLYKRKKPWMLCINMNCPSKEKPDETEGETGANDAKIVEDIGPATQLVDNQDEAKQIVK